MTGEWVQPQSSAAELALKRDTALARAEEFLARARGDFYSQDDQAHCYACAQTELAFAEYYATRAKELLARDTPALSNLTEPQDPSA